MNIQLAIDRATTRLCFVRVFFIYCSFCHRAGYFFHLNPWSKKRGPLQYMRRSPKVSEVLPLLYLRGLSTNDFRPALKELLGEDASGLSSTAITRLTAKWQIEYDEFRKRDLSKDDYAYIWVDGVHFNVRLEEHRLCTLKGANIAGLDPGTGELTRRFHPRRDRWREHFEWRGRPPWTHRHWPDDGGRPSCQPWPPRPVAQSAAGRRCLLVPTPIRLSSRPHALRA